MKLFSTCLGMMVVLGGMTVASSVQAGYLIPIASNYENSNHNIKLLVESEMTRLNQESIKYQEILYTDLLGKTGGGSLGKNNVIEEMKDAAKDGASVIDNTTPKLDKISQLSTYKGATKEALEKNYVLQAKQGLEYNEEEIAEIRENQRIAIDELARKGIAQAAAEIVEASKDKTYSEKDKRSEDISEAKDMNAMYEMMLGMDRRNYERSLRISAVEAADAGIRAMQTLQGLSRNAPGRHEMKETE